MEGGEVLLSDVATINPSLPRRPSEAASVTFLRMSDVDEVLATTKPGAIRPFGEVARGYTAFLREDLLVAKITPCFENGKIAAPAIATAVGTGSTEFHVVRPDTDLIDTRFLLHLLRTDRVRALGRLRMTGSAGQRRLPASFLSNLRLRIPQISEQEALARMLDRVQELCDAERRAIWSLEQLERNLFVQRFGDPVRNPNGWPRQELGALGRLDRGVSRHRPRNAPELLGGPYPLIQTGDVARAGARIRAWSATYSESGLAQSKIWPAGTLCITIAANIADAAVIEFDACFPDSVVGFTADEATTEYVRVWLSLRKAAIEAMASESAQKNINLRVLRQLQVLVPPEDTRESFARSVRGILRHQDTRRARLERLGELYRSLQYRAFAGGP